MTNSTHIGITARDVADMLHGAVGDGSVPRDGVYPWYNGGGENVGTERLTHVVAVLSLLEAVNNVGWVEHTNDWDWFIDVTMEDGTEIYDSDDGAHLEKQDGTPIELNFVAATRPEADNVWLVLQPSRGDGDDSPVRVPVAQIAKLDVREEH